MKDVFYGDKTKNVRGNRSTELLEHISALFTKEEVIAILTDLQVEIEKMDSREHECDFATPWCIDKGVVVEIIQEKIDKLKEVQQDVDK